MGSKLIKYPTCISVRCSFKQKETIEDMCDEMSVSMSEYLREMALREAKEFHAPAAKRKRKRKI